MKEYCYVVGVRECNIRYISCFDAEGILLCDDAAQAIKWDSEEAAQQFADLIANHYITDGFGDFWIRSLVVKVYPME